MSIFAVGGNFWIALAPVLALLLVSFFGLKGTLGLMVPGIGMGNLLLFSLTWLSTVPVRDAFIQVGRRRKSP